jgi:hypothetical protein
MVDPRCRLNPAADEGLKASLRELYALLGGKMEEHRGGATSKAQ